MHLVESQFTDFEQFKKFAIGWDLDFKLLSRNNFIAYLNLYSNESFQLGRTKLIGTIHQNGLVPKGFRTIVLPANSGVSYNWLHKDVNSEQLLIFPRNGILESVSFDNFDVFVLSVSEQKLAALIDSFGFGNTERVFAESEKYLSLDSAFLRRFSMMANEFLHYTKNHVKLYSEEIENQMVEQILYVTLKYIDETNEIVQKSIIRKRDVALKKSLEYIIENRNRLLSVKELCDFSKVSERTLEYAFIEKYQVSPSHYVKAHHLNLVKNELLLSKGQKVKVADIASRYGFYHMGQFSIDFKKQFGISPSKIND